MKLERYTEVKGALRTPKYREVNKSLNVDANSTFEYDAQDVYKANQELRDTVIVLSQLMRSFSAMYNIMDTSALDPDIKAGIDAMVAELESYSTLGDEVFGDYGMDALTSMLNRQEQIAQVYQEQPGAHNTSNDVYKGLKRLGQS